MDTPEPSTGAVTIRQFDGEYTPIIAIQKAINPDEQGSVEEWRFGDQQWRHDRYFQRRFVAEAPNGKIVAWGQVFHMPWQFHPHKYRMSLDVHPAHQRRGIGTRLYEHLLGVLGERGAAILRVDTQESRTASIEFLAHRGFTEIQRYWESRLDVSAFDFDAFSTAEARAAQQGISITTLAEELARDGNAESTLQAIYELESAAFMDVPFPDPPTPFHFDEWREWVLRSPGGLHDAFFLAKDGDRYAGVSNMHKNDSQPGVIFQGFTGVLRAFRGRGVAMALKMETVKYARQHGYREIRTGNNTRNRPMLRINEAMGFVKQPVWIEYEKAL
ncbi:MAG: GNAT family N-acetyltransferase [Chloroflexota bacterium]|nr:GNAT family N-acetyltransferase [Chloroflexota bacterium]